ncbi:site-specific integrase [Caryophanon tenue]|uniref:Tyr recombinase domain-containing protein n=1 Tax=Caryophanon tenue TaxID=33978 RepID=A0A1C0YKX6_9BACL|nr:site-specific integrase [Caryophanon tenue]OCS87818.1 hypothetical protein A6M13_11000 [Caryophanon tenue]
MSITILNNIISYSHPQKLKSMDEYLRKVDVKGFHYISFISSKGITYIVNPDHVTNNTATNMLIALNDHNKSPNTIKRIANDLTKFLDYLMLFKINLDEIMDLEDILIGFAVYLQVLGTSSIKVQKSIEWSLIDYVPLVDDSIQELVSNEYGQKYITQSSGYTADHIVQHIQNAIKYLEQYNEEKAIPLNTIPRKSISNKSTFSSTIKDTYDSTVYDANYILARSGLNHSNTNKLAKPTKERIPSLSEMNIFMSVSKEKNTFIHNLLLLTLKGFGLRSAEVSNIKFFDSLIPANFLSLPYDQAISFLKNSKNLGDIYYNNSIKRWTCNVVIAEGRDYSKRNKSGSREVSYIFEQEEFSAALYLVIRERLLIFRAKPNLETSNFLFLNPRNKMKAFKNYTSNNIITSMSKRVSKASGIAFSWIHPHTFRHYFATYLLRIKKFTLDDVSRMLGHSDTDVTRGTYIHYLEEDTSDEGNIIEKIKDAYSSDREVTNGLD